MRIPSIIRTRRADGVVSSFQIDEAQWNNLVDANHAIQQVAAKYPRVQKTMQAADLKPVMESVKYFLWLNPDRAGMLFAQHVLLVEGPSETALINRLLDDGKIALPQGTYVLDCLGKYNIHRFMNLLSSLGVVHAVLHDDDNHANEHQELNQLVADSKNADFTHSVITIPKDLEDYLGVAPPGSSYRKPQHLLYCYATNQIDNAKLGGCCALAQSCFAMKDGKP